MQGGAEDGERRPQPHSVAMGGPAGLSRRAEPQSVLGLCQMRKSCWIPGSSPSCSFSSPKVSPGRRLCCSYSGCTHNPLAIPT